MRFLFCQGAGDENLEIKGDAFAHIKAQRKRDGELLRLQNLRENIAYFYEIKELLRSSAMLVLKEQKALEKQEFKTRLGWAVCDSSTIEKTLPFLNELGLGELVLFYSDFSQRNVKLDFARFERILISSCEQCGRYEMMKISLLDKNELKNCILLDFGGDEFVPPKDDELLLIGAEGGFSEAERAQFQRKMGLKCKNILRSQTAIISVLAKILA